MVGVGKLKKLGKKVLLMGGGVFNFSLMVGVLVVFIDCGFEFDVVLILGVGVLMGLFYVVFYGGKFCEVL